MTPRDPDAIVASIHDRLLNKAKAEHRPFQELLQYFAMERFLYRLSQSQHRESFVLKGGLMLRFWETSFSGPTLDEDLRRFLRPVLKHIVTRQSFRQHWTASGSWMQIK